MLYELVTRMYIFKEAGTTFAISNLKGGRPKPKVAFACMHVLSSLKTIDLTLYQTTHFGLSQFEENGLQSKTTFQNVIQLEKNVPIGSRQHCEKRRNCT